MGGGGDEGNAEKYLLEAPGLWPEHLRNQQRDTIVRRLANDRAEKTKMAPKDMECKPFPNYLQYAKSNNGLEKIKRDWLIPNIFFNRPIGHGGAQNFFFSWGPKCLADPLHSTSTPLWTGQREPMYQMAIVKAKPHLIKSRHKKLSL